MEFLLFLVLLIVLWQCFYFFGVEVFMLWKAYSVPSPIGVWERFIELGRDGTIVTAALNSVLRGFVGYVIAVVIGTILGFLIHRFSYLQRNLKPIILGIQTLPSICFVPFSILWFGISTQAILFVVVMGASFSIAVSVDHAIKSVPPIYKKAALTMGANQWQMYRYVILPASLPSLVSGLKHGWSFAWRALMSGEVMTSSIGLGQTLVMGRDLADINQVMLVMLVIIVIGIVIDKGIFSVIEGRIMKKRGML